MQRPAALISAGSFAGGGRRPLRWAVIFVAAVALAIAGGAVRDRLVEPEQGLDPAGLVAGHGPADYKAALSRAELDLASARRQWALAPGEWLRGEFLARALLARHRVTGDYADLVEADRLLDAGLARAPDPSGPALSRASLSLYLHRLPEAEAALARASRWFISTPAERADALALGGDIAQQRGNLLEARRAYARSQALAPDFGVVLRQTVLLGRTGERAEAKAGLEKLLARPRQPPGVLAELALQRAQLAYAEGEWEDAGRWVGAADRLFPGYWLTQAYSAQALALAGRRDEAVRRYAAIAAARNSPEVMDALAQLLRLEGRRSDSMAWWRRADALWRERLRLFPEATALHAAEHALIGGRVDEALELARAEVRRRPHGATLSLLARAALVAGRPDEALAALDRAERQGWVSAGLLMLRSEAAASLGDEEASATARDRAEEINPRAADPRTRLIWFGHD